MGEVFSAVFGFLAAFLLMMAKPEWFYSWWVELIERKFSEKDANKITNAIGVKFVEVGISLIEKIPDEGLVEDVLVVREKLEAIKGKVLKG